jgi:HPt (histidine-containing phosphotransfer) domain-containing protein
MDDPIDRTATLALAGSNREFLRELVQIFLEDYPPLLADIRAAASARDGERLRRAAHTLRGAVGNFGARTAFAAAGAVEALGQSGDFTDVDKACRDLEEAVRRLPPALAELTSE